MASIYKGKLFVWMVPGLINCPDRSLLIETKATDHTTLGLGEHFDAFHPHFTDDKTRNTWFVPQGTHWPICEQCHPSLVPFP